MIAAQCKRDLLPYNEFLILLSKFKNNNCIDSRNEILEYNYKLVFHRVHKRFLSRGCFEDLVQIGIIGLIRAVERFDPSYGVQFTTFAVPMIDGEILRFLRDDGMVKVPRIFKEHLYSIAKAKQEMLLLGNFDPTNKEIADYLNITEEMVFLTLLSNKDVNSINQVVHECDGETVTYMDMLHCNDNNYFEKMELKEAIEKALDEREQDIIISRFFKDMAQGDLAKKYDISQVQVSRLEKKALEKIRLFMEDGSIKKSAYKPKGSEIIGKERKKRISI